MNEVEPKSIGAQYFLDYWHILARRRMAVLMFLGLFVGTVLLGSLTATRYYSSTAVLEISPKAPVALDLSEVNELVATPSANTLRFYYYTQYKIIQSRTVLSGTVQRLREEHAVTDFDEIKDPAQYLRGMLQVEPEMDTHLVKITITHSDPEKAALFANVLGQVYIQNNLDRAMGTTIEAEKWLEKRQEEYRIRKIETDGQIQTFKASADIVGLDDEQNTATATLTRLQEAWSVAHTQRVQLQAEHQEMQRLATKGEPLALAAFLAGESAALGEMLSNYRKLEQNRSQLEARYKDQWPEVRQLDSELAGLGVQIGAEVNATIKARGAALEVIRQREEALATDIEIMKTKVEELERKLIQLNILRTEAERNDALYKSLDLRRSRVGLAKVMEANNISFMDRAVPSGRPVKPRVAVNLLMALVFGVFGGGLFAFVIEYFDASVRGREDVEHLIGVPFLGIVPLAVESEIAGLRAPIDRNIPSFALPKSNVAESLRSIRTQALIKLPKEGLRSILITSASPQEGKSFISANLSAMIAMAGNRVLLLDADMRRPTIHKLFCQANTIGLAELLAGTATFAEVRIRTHVPGLDVILAGQAPDNPAELLEKDRLLRAVEAVGEYDVVVIDSPPVNAVADPVVLASSVSGVILVVQTDRTRRANVIHARERLSEVGARMLGAIVNKVQVSKSGYGYYYYYYSNYGYYGRAEGGPDDGSPEAPAVSDAETQAGSARADA